jgi:hypothetical protein
MIYGDDRVMVETPSHTYALSEADDLLLGDQAALLPPSFIYNMTAVLEDSLKLVNPDCELTRLLFYPFSASST